MAQKASNGLDRPAADVTEIHQRQRLNRGVPGRLSDADRWRVGAYRVHMRVWMTVVRPTAPYGDRGGQPLRRQLNGCSSVRTAFQTRPRVTSPCMCTSPVSASTSRRSWSAVRAGSCGVRALGVPLA